MQTLPTAVARQLAQVDRPGDFYATGTVDLHPPRLEVDGVGPVALPLLSLQAEQLIAVSEQAPYGRGTETLVDTDVRRTRQIDAARVRIGGKHWACTLEQVVAQASAGLGVEGQVVAELYKLLVYEPGGFFIEHRDTEKAPGMFATLVVILPSEYAGGELLVRHKGEQAVLDLHRDDPCEVAFAAFYADCVHEVRPITHGHRLTLVYNLIRPAGGRSARPSPPDYSRPQHALTALLGAWSQDGGGPDKLVIPLEHAYTEAEIGFHTLKGADAAAANVLAAAARGADCEVFTALLRIEETGIAEYYGGYYRRGGQAQDDFEAGEVIDYSATLSHWQRPDGSDLSLGALPYLDEEISPPGALDDLEPDETEFSEATGNEGASFDRLYRRGVLVVWPRNRRMEVIAQAGPLAALPFLGEIARQWRAEGAIADSPTWREGHRLAALLHRDWPTEPWRRRQAGERGDSRAFLGHLCTLGDTERIDAFLAEIVAAGAYGADDNAALVGALSHLPADRAAELLTALVVGNADTSPGGCAALLGSAVEAGLATGRLQPAAEALVTSLTTPEGERPAYNHWDRPPQEEPVEQLVATLPALEHIDPALAQLALDHLLGDTMRYPVDTVQVPALLRLCAHDATRHLASVLRLRERVTAHLRARVAQPLDPPADWRRSDTVTCNCRNCRELAQFLADPDRPDWRFTAAQAERSHLESSIRSSRCDIDCTTEKRGRPHTLVCRKNQASYERRVEQRRSDLEHLERLGAAG